MFSTSQSLQHRHVNVFCIWSCLAFPVNTSSYCSRRCGSSHEFFLLMKARRIISVAVVLFCAGMGGIFWLAANLLPLKYCPLHCSGSPSGPLSTDNYIASIVLIYDFLLEGVLRLRPYILSLWGFCVCHWPNRPVPTQKIRNTPEMLMCTSPKRMWCTFFVELNKTPPPKTRNRRAAFSLLAWTQSFIDRTGPKVLARSG